MRFEHWIHEVKQYYSNNEVFTAEEFREAYAEEDQTKYFMDCASCCFALERVWS